MPPRSGSLLLVVAPVSVWFAACSATSETPPPDAPATAVTADGGDGDRDAREASLEDAPNTPTVDGGGKDAAPACPGCGFWDDFSVGTWRTDFDDPDAGLSGHPLTLLDCPYPLGTDPEVLNGAGPTYYDENKSAQVACDRTSTTYGASNAASSSAAWPLDRFWVISANNERSYGPEGTCSDDGPNTGPPNQSKKVVAPGAGVFGVDVSGGKATLAIDTNAFSNCVAPTDKGKIPFLSLGAQTGRGQKDPITYLNDPSVPATLAFRATIEDIAPAGVASSLGKQRANFAYVFIEAQWGGVRRWAYVYLMARTAGVPGLTRGHWNWNIQESLWFPGAELVYVGADQLSSMCNDPKIVAGTMLATPGASFDYSIDLNALFRCFSTLPQKGWTNPLPTSKLAITGVHWAIEQTYGKNWTRLTVQDLRLTH